ncbi:unnamed protein product [Pseudo-nitzschia multistriata]|uniref:Sugar phosphate transporter domain-containing protein n=1 Tax=Pseudo-nitzschia multistriata TaxID=183589 RepID=A0A448ZCK6_9STRA|nr:unnamed protein product [Pseudo-nitzschia multistriata]
MERERLDRSAKTKAGPIEEDHHHEALEQSTNGSEPISPLALPLHETITDCRPVNTGNDNQNTGDNNHYSLGRQKFGALHPWLVTLSVLIYWTFVSLIPVYNKYFFQESLFPYPIATAAIQLGVVSVLCAAINIFQKYFFSPENSGNSFCGKTSTNVATDTKTSARGASTNTSFVVERSWILGPHFWWKMKWCFPIGVLFGVKYSVSNLGLHLVSAPTHLLLQSTDLVWTVLGARWINGEQSSLPEMVCLVGCIAGSICLSWQLLFDGSNNGEDSALAATVVAIAINLSSPILLGLCLSTLRLACTELMRPDNRVGGTVSAIELTSIKLVISSLVGLAMACCLERGATGDAAGTELDTWWTAFAGLAASTQLGVVCGAFLVSVFQVNCTFLTFLTSTVALGIVGQVKIIPQWIFASIAGVGVDSRPTGFFSVLGAILVMSSAAGFAMSNLVAGATTNGHDLASEHEENCDLTTTRQPETSTISPGEQTPLLNSPVEMSFDDRCCPQAKIKPTL